MIEQDSIHYLHDKEPFDGLHASCLHAGRWREFPRVVEARRGWGTLVRGNCVQHNRATSQECLWKMSTIWGWGDSSKDVYKTLCFAITSTSQGHLCQNSPGWGRGVYSSKRQLCVTQQGHQPGMPLKEDPQGGGGVTPARMCVWLHVCVAITSTSPGRQANTTCQRCCLPTGFPAQTTDCEVQRH